MGKAPPGELLLEVRGLKVVFASARGTVEAVRGVDLAVAPGEAVALVGSSGSGKSVTAMAIAGLLPTRAVTVRADVCRLADRDLLELTPEGRARIRGGRIGMVFQDPLSALNPVMRVGRQIAESIELHAPPSAGGSVQEAVVRWLARVGIPGAEGVARAYPHELSGGMRQRVMIAIALAGEPDLLIADEPTTALDVTVQAQIMALVKRLRRELGMAMLWISHDLALVAGLAERVVVMDQGHTIEEGAVEQLFEKPAHAVTAELVRLSRAGAVLPEPGGSAP